MNEQQIMSELTDEVSAIANKRIPMWNIAFLLDNESYMVAGGCFGVDTPNDYDIYPANGKPFNRKCIREQAKSLAKKRECSVVHESKNAITVKCDGKLLQFCDYVKSSLPSLVMSFDFTHCQVGVLVKTTEDENGGFGAPYVNEVFFTPEWVMARVTLKTKFTGSEYPLGSLVRTFKYAKRGLLNASETRGTVLEILTAIIDRGYKDYNDFKDQLEAVDLLSLCEDESGPAWNFWRVCCDVEGLVANTYVPEEKDA